MKTAWTIIKVAAASAYVLVCFAAFIAFGAYCGWTIARDLAHAFMGALR